ncbi:hypothetical protein VNO80_25519 [Phaseolus coccineus]|uniref:SHSP domain-containing protein n=1 Tax=Phaseolus coccineus TaxID=3886 RepID=A0AAN9LY01_PHACN
MFSEDCRARDLAVSSKELQPQHCGLIGTEISNIQVHVDNGKVVEISGQWKPQKGSKESDWRCGHWWEHGYVRRLEMPQNADLKIIEAHICNGRFFEVRIAKYP